MGFFPYVSASHQRWVKNYKPAILIRDHGRYLRLDVADRTASVAEWNRPRWGALAGGLLALGLLGWVLARRRPRSGVGGGKGAGS